MQQEAIYQLLINKRESVGLKHCNDPKDFIEYSSDMYDFMKIRMSTIKTKNSKY